MFVGVFSWLLIDVEWPSSLRVVPALGRVVRRCIWMQTELVMEHKQHSGVLSASVPASRCLPWAPALASLDYGLQPVSWCEPLPPRSCFWSWYLAAECKAGRPLICRLQCSAIELYCWETFDPYKTFKEIFIFLFYLFKVWKSVLFSMNSKHYKLGERF